MTPHTASSLSQVLREVWSEDVFKKAFDLELQDMQRDMQQQIYRQFHSGLQGQVRFPDEPNPFSYNERAARQRELMQRLAIAQRKGKPSYRQRQKNGRAGRKK